MDVDRGGRGERPDDTLLIVDGRGCKAFCPACGGFVDDERVEVDDYVGSNCLLWCNIHGEILLCATGARGAGGHEAGDVARIEAGSAPLGPCLAEVSAGDAEAYAAQRGFDWWAAFGGDAVEPGTRFFRTGALRVTHFGRAAEDEGGVVDPTAVHWTALETPARCFGDAAATVDTGHAGEVLYYRATCARCGAAHVSYVSGD